MPSNVVLHSSDVVSRMRGGQRERIRFDTAHDEPRDRRCSHLVRAGLGSGKGVDHSHDTRGRGAAGDVAGATRTIEVKAYGCSARGQDLWLETRQVEHSKRDPDFWLYVVENVRQGDPARFRLLEIGGDTLRSLIDRTVERRYFTVPWPVAIYDALASQQHSS
jgi:hypothetical protein